MDNIGNHRNTLRQRFTPRKEAVEIIASAKSLVEIALRSNHLLARHRRKLISEALWWISEADGKYSTRFRTQEVYKLATADGNDEVKIQHEHVHPRKEVARELISNAQMYLADAEKLEKLLGETVGCVVTVSQHRSLKAGCRGWSRYEGIDVYDMNEDPPAIYRHPA